ncbi:MAG: ATP-dependent Clp protease adaptor ClpS [Phycisphaeraceae bacterium]|nr:ATP-dependent Clp protease adaptor ClpS [Phycisphaeraceae bacterium]
MTDAAEEQNAPPESEPPRDSAPESPEEEGSTATKEAPARPDRRQMPPWKVLLHNDDENIMSDVVQTVLMLTPLGKTEAVVRVVEAHETGVTLLLTTHKERAELYRDQFRSRDLIVTIEPAEDD